MKDSLIIYTTGKLPGAVVYALEQGLHKLALEQEMAKQALVLVSEAGLPAGCLNTFFPYSVQTLEIEVIIIFKGGYNSSVRPGA